MIWVVFVIWVIFAMFCGIMDFLKNSQLYLVLFLLSLPIMFYLPFME